MARRRTRSSFTLALTVAGTIAFVAAAYAEPSGWTLHLDDSGARLNSERWTVRATSAHDGPEAMTLTGPVRARTDAMYVVAERATVDGERLTLTDGTVFAEGWQLRAATVVIDGRRDAIQLEPPFGSSQPAPTVSSATRE